MPHKLLLTGLVASFSAVLAGSARSQDAILFAEKFDPAEPYRVELKVRLSGRLAVPTEKGKAPQVLPISGSSTLIYDERPLAAEDAKTAKAIRAYREVEFARTVDGKDQKAEIRPAVRRMVVLRSDRGKKAPFSPDGPLTWGEIDVVRTDLFTPALVPALLPTKPVKPGDKWTATAVAVAELTDFDPILEGSLSVEFVSTLTLNNKQYAKLSILGTVIGSTDDGPSRQKLDGLAYFELDAKRLAYLNLKGTHELLGPDGKTVVGKIDGTFVMTRTPAGRVSDLTDEALRGLDLRPTPANTELLYDNPDLGLKFNYPRRWRVGTAQGRQLTIEESSGGTIILTVEPATTLPTADQYLKESQEFLKKQNWAVTAVDSPRRVTDRPNRLDRFSLDADVKGERIRMEYAVASQADGGATVAARLPWRERETLERDVDRILRTIAITKRIEK